MKRNRKGKCQVVFRLHKACYSSKFKHIFSCVAVHNAVLSLLELVFLTVKCVFLNRKICECGQTNCLHAKKKKDLQKHSHIMCKLTYLKSDFKKTPCTACNMVSHTNSLASLQIRIQLHSRVGWLQRNERNGKCKCLENSAEG